MTTNPHFEKTVRIQADRGHRVIDTGPYRLVRHPGYAGFALVVLGSPGVLGSAWAFVPAVACLLWMALRTVAEDRTLRAEREGYEDYAGRVRARWLPGVW